MQAHILQAVDKKISSYGLTVVHAFANTNAMRMVNRAYVMKDLTCVFSFMYAFTMDECTFQFQSPGISDEEEPAVYRYVDMNNELLTLVDDMCMRVPK